MVKHRRRQKEGTLPNTKNELYTPNSFYLTGWPASHLQNLNIAKFRVWALCIHVYTLSSQMSNWLSISECKFKNYQENNNDSFIISLMPFPLYFDSWGYKYTEVLYTGKTGEIELMLDRDDKWMIKMLALFRGVAAEAFVTLSGSCFAQLQVIAICRSQISTRCIEWLRSMQST